ncbi:hypothetical protein pb186bvf_007840 [Paramecium bursaria]
MEDQLLKKVIKKIGTKWLDVASQMPDRNASQCSQRWKRIKPNENEEKKSWTSSEDKLLVELIEQYGEDYRMIQNFFPEKTIKGIKDRYIYKLNPTINTSPMTEMEDYTIYEWYLKLGPQWKKISLALQNRTPIQVKNRFHHHVKQKYLNISNPYYTKFDEDNITQEPCVLDFYSQQIFDFQYESGYI